MFKLQGDNGSVSHFNQFQRDCQRARSPNFVRQCGDSVLYNVYGGSKPSTLRGGNKYLGLCDTTQHLIKCEVLAGNTKHGGRRAQQVDITLRVETPPKVIPVSKQKVGPVLGGQICQYVKCATYEIQQFVLGPYDHGDRRF